MSQGHIFRWKSVHLFLKEGILRTKTELSFLGFNNTAMALGVGGGGGTLSAAPPASVRIFVISSSRMHRFDEYQNFSIMLTVLLLFQKLLYLLIITFYIFVKMNQFGLTWNAFYCLLRLDFVVKFLLHTDQLRLLFVLIVKTFF